MCSFAAACGLPCTACDVPPIPPAALPRPPASRDGYVSAILCADGRTLSLDLLAASEAAAQRMGEAAQQLCEQLVAEWPGTRLAASSVSRMPRA